MSVQTQNRFMEFSIGDQFYCFPLPLVREVIRAPELTQVPGAPSDFEGMMNLRGQIMGVFNIRKKLNAKTKSANESENPPVVVVIEEMGVTVGVIVDEVVRVLHPDPADIRPAPLKNDDPSKQYIDAVIQTEEHLTMILSVENLLNLKLISATLKSA